MGRVLLEKAKVEPGKAFIFIDGELQYDLDEKPLIDDANPRWLGSGRIMYNNKGEPVKQYEPYFSNTHEYEKESEAREFGVSPLLHYDTLGRNVRIDHPDGSYEKVIFDCWQQKNHDRNDTVKDSEWYAGRNSPQPGDPEPNDPEERSAWLAIKHYDTPEILGLDVLGVVFRQRQDNGVYDGMTTNHVYYDTIFETDIEGKRKKVTDARGLEISHQYDMRPIQEDEEGNSDGGTIIQSESPDSGLKIQLTSVDGQPLFAVDAAGNHFLYEYDALRRPLKVKVKKENAGSYVTTALYEYGEDIVNPELNNLRGQLYRLYNASGLSQNNAFDFKGNLLNSPKQLLEDATLSEVDWEGSTSPVLSTEVFESSMTYDALNRPLTQTDSGGNITENTYNEGGALKTVKLNGTNYVQDIHYNEKGQRRAIWYGNGTKTSYSYDEFTFRLRRLLTVKLSSNEILQDLNYWYDPVGNITEIQDDAQQTLFFNNTVIAPTQKFVYDSIYRLSEAKGRELISTADLGSEDNWNDAAWKTSHKGDGNAVQNYIQKYIYDEVGNILELQHVAGTGSYTRNYSYDVNSNKLLSTEVGSNTYSYSHDSRGNMTTMPHLSAMNWNAQNELSSIMNGSEPTNYQYSNGERVRKFTDKGIIKEERIYFGNYEIYRKFISGVLDIERTTVHISDDTGRIAMLEMRTIGIDPSPEELTKYIYNNHLQSASLELDEEGAIISYEEYHPYGTTSYQAMNASINATAKRYRYTGKERDEESGLYYHGARYYVPWLARWTAVDPMESKYAGMSPYNYGFNNPVVWNDLSGMQPGDDEQLSPPPTKATNEHRGVWYREHETNRYKFALGVWEGSTMEEGKVNFGKSEYGSKGTYVGATTSHDYFDGRWAWLAADGSISIYRQDNFPEGEKELIKFMPPEDWKGGIPILESLQSSNTISEATVQIPTSMSSRTQLQNGSIPLEKIEQIKPQRIENNQLDLGLSIGGLALLYMETGLVDQQKVASRTPPTNPGEVWGNKVGRNISKWVGRAGRITGFASISSSIMKARKEPTLANIGKATLNLIVTVGTRANIVGLGISVLYTIADESGWLDRAFNTIRK